MVGLAGLWDPDADEQTLRRDLERMRRVLEVPTVPQVAADAAAAGIACTVLARHAVPTHAVAHDDVERVWLAFDGEIYNRDELSARLTDRRRAAATGDARLCLELLHAEGESFAGRLNGQFNLIVYRVREGRLSIATDRHGYRPLFVAQRQRKVLFATAMKAIIAALEGTPTVDGIGLLELICGGWPMGDRTWVDGIRVATPGCWIHFTADRSWESRYFRVRFEGPSAGRSLESHAEGLAEKLTQAIRRQTAPAGRFAIPLSGGLDSRALLLATPGERPPALTYTFGRADSFDVLYAQRLAHAAGVPHRHFTYSAGYLGRILDGVVWLTEGLNPFAEVAFGSLQFHDHIGAEVDALLYGHCGDCLTGAHLPPSLIAMTSRQRLIEMVFRRYNHVADAALRRVLNGTFYRRYTGSVFEDVRKTFDGVEGETMADILNAWDMENRQRRGTFGSTVVDRYRFEVRAPFLDNDVVDHLRRARLSWRLQQIAYKRMHITVFPAAAKVPWAYTGRPLRRSLAGDFAQQGINYVRRRLRRQQPNPRDFRNLTADTSNDARLAQVLRDFVAHECFPADVFDRKGIEDTIEDHWNGRGDLTHLVVMLATFAAAWRMFVFAAPPAMPADAMPQG
jgi:asparagine synthetase B (glutamine-hydrolysing)